MSIQHEIVHTTVYRYSQPVSFGEHRVMFRPRDSHDQRVLATDLQVTPEAIVRMIQDPHSNSIAMVQPLQSATELRIVCSFTIEHAIGQEPPLPMPSEADVLPFVYSPDERMDLEHYLRPHHADPQGVLMAWTRRFLRADAPTNTRDLLARMNASIGQTLRYVPRDEEGTQSPTQTLALGSGSCRDFALLMMESIRRLGVAARFVSGYLYDAALDGGGDVVQGSGVTHAWLQAYLPGAGWLTYDPTNNLTGGSQLVRVAVVRDPDHASPVSGSWYGTPGSFLGMSASVQVRRRTSDAAELGHNGIGNPAPGAPRLTRQGKARP
jgi:transglutaminase-like putative cysteine protease